jgi:hypothetical protein
MRRKDVLSLATVIGLVVAGFVVPVVFAKGNPHLKIPTMGWAAGSLTATGVVVGLANEVYLVELYAQGSAGGICANPAGDREVQGRNPSPIVVAIREPDEVDTDQNGSVCFELTASEKTEYILVSPTPKEFGCPNENWSVEVVPGSTDWTDATITLFATDKDGNPVGDPLEVTHFKCVTTFGDRTTVDCTADK